MADIQTLARRLAADERLSDYDFWRWLKDIENLLYRVERERSPVPFHLLYVRRLLRNARLRRRGREYL